MDNCINIMIVTRSVIIILFCSRRNTNWYKIYMTLTAAFKYKKLCCRKEAARCFVSVWLLYTQMVWLPDGEKNSNICLFVLTWSTNVKNRRFHVPQPTFLFPLETALRLSRNVLHGWKGNSMLAKPLAACTYLSSIVSELYDAEVNA